MIPILVGIRQPFIISHNSLDWLDSSMGSFTWGLSHICYEMAAGPSAPLCDLYLHMVSYLG